MLRRAELTTQMTLLGINNDMIYMIISKMDRADIIILALTCKGINGLLFSRALTLNDDLVNCLTAIEYDDSVKILISFECFDSYEKIRPKFGRERSEDTDKLRIESYRMLESTIIKSREYNKNEQILCAIKIGNLSRTIFLLAKYKKFCQNNIYDGKIKAKYMLAALQHI